MDNNSDFLLEQKICISVPKNQRGIEYLDSFRTGSDDEEDFILTRRQYDFLEPVFDRMNEQFGLLIDAFEEEVIPADKAASALEIVFLYQKEHVLDPEKSGVEILISALETAIRLNMPVYLFF